MKFTIKTGEGDKEVSALQVGSLFVHKESVNWWAVSNKYGHRIIRVNSTRKGTAELVKNELLKIDWDIKKATKKHIMLARQVGLKYKNIRIG